MTSKNFMVDKLIFCVILSDMTHSAATLAELFTRLPDLTTDDPEWALVSRDWNGRLSLTAVSEGAESVGTTTVFEVVGGTVRPSAGHVAADPGDITLHAPAAVWDGMLEATPRPHLHCPMGAAYHGFEASGHPETVAQYWPAVHRAVALLRDATSAVPVIPPPSRPADAPVWDQAVGRYAHLTIDGDDYRVYIEEAGQGIPVLLQHTAGADGRQWRHLLDDPTLTQRFRFIAYDLPYHGKSLPSTSSSWWTEPYQLTREFLMQVPLAVIAALDLDRPIFMGSSIGGHLSVDLAYYHPDSVRAVIGLEAALKQEAQIDLTYLYHPRVSNAYKATGMYGLTAPTAPEALRRETIFVYSQGAPPTFSGDLHYWQTEHDLRGLAGQIDTRRCQVYLLTGEYDWATTPEMSQQLADEILGATYQTMAGLGHFPMCEDPAKFLSYVEPILDTIAQSTTASA
jgi:pimeloyl-ACP methyl ester carboxylesterase